MALLLPNDSPHQRIFVKLIFARTSEQALW